MVLIAIADNVEIGDKKNKIGKNAVSFPETAKEILSTDINALKYLFVDIEFAKELQEYQGEFDEETGEYEYIGWYLGGGITPGLAIAYNADDLEGVGGSHIILQEHEKASNVL